MSARPAPNDPSVVKPGVRVVRRRSREGRVAWGILVRHDGMWQPLRRPHRGAKSGFADCWWATRNDERDAWIEDKELVPLRGAA